MVVAVPRFVLKEVLVGVKWGVLAGGFLMVVGVS